MRSKKDEAIIFLTNYIATKKTGGWHILLKYHISMAIWLHSIIKPSGKEGCDWYRNIIQVRFRPWRVFLSAPTSFIVYRRTSPHRTAEQHQHCDRDTPKHRGTLHGLCHTNSPAQTTFTRTRQLFQGHPRMSIRGCQNRSRDGHANRLGRYCRGERCWRAALNLCESIAV